MATKKSMLEITKSIIEKSDKAVKFSKLWEQVCSDLKIDEETSKTQISSFYTELTSCGLFVQEKDNSWNLASRVPFEKAHIKETLEEGEELEGYTDDLDEGESATLGADLNSGIRSEESVDGQTEEEEEKGSENKLADFIK